MRKSKAAAPAPAPDPEKRGRGRPTVADDVKKSETLRVRVTPAEAEAYESLGGSDWIRVRLARELAKQKKAALA